MGKTTIEFFRGHRRQWVAAIYRNSVCVSWQTVGTIRNVRRIIKKQLEPIGASYRIYDLKG